MATEPLLTGVYTDFLKVPTDYCSICFRTSKERRLLDGKNLAKFKFFRQSVHLEIRADFTKFCNGQKICYMCDAQATAAIRFCVAVNLSQHLHNMFNRMKKVPQYEDTILAYLQRLAQHQTEQQGCPEQLYHNDKNVEEMQTMLERHRRNTTLLQTETLLLNNPGDDSKARTTTSSPPRLRDLLSFEDQSADDDTLFHLDASVINKQIIIEDDDPIKEEPPDQNVFILPDKLPSSTSQPDLTQTDSSTRYILHPIVMNNGTITIPSLDSNGSLTNPTLIVNGSNNSNNISSLNNFVVIPQPAQNTNQNRSNLNFMQNTNSLAKNIVSLVKNPPALIQNTPVLVHNSRNIINNTSNSTQNSRNLLNNSLNSTQNSINLLNNSLNSTQNSRSLYNNTSNLSQNTLTPQKASIIQHMSGVIENTLKLPSKPITVKKMAPVKVTAAVPASPVTRVEADSDSNANCQSIQPIRKPDGKIDWEDKIPMDVISFVSPSDPTTAKRQKVSPAVTYQDPMDKCVITDVKSIRVTDVIDLC